MEKTQESDLSLVSVYRLLVENWKLIAMVCIVSSAIAAVVMLLTKTQYKNITLFFPVSAQVVEKASLLDENSFNGTGIFATESLVDQVYNIATSSAVQNMVIKDNDLVRHYGYNPSKPSANKKTAKKYAKRIRVRRTPYNSLELTVKDVDHTKATVIAQDLLDKTEEIYHRFLKVTRENLVNNIDSQIAIKNIQIAAWSDTLAQMRDQYRFYGVISPSTSTPVIPSTGAITGKAFEKLQTLEELKEGALKDVSSLHSVRTKIKLTAVENQYMLHLVKKPTDSMEKAGPLRTLTVLLTAVFSIIAIIIILILKRQYEILRSKAYA